MLFTVEELLVGLVVNICQCCYSHLQLAWHEGLSMTYVSIRLAMLQMLRLCK